MTNKNIYKLYHVENGYKCKVNIMELVFLFNIDEKITDINIINHEITKYNYYIKL